MFGVIVFLENLILTENSRSTTIIIPSIRNSTYLPPTKAAPKHIWPNPVFNCALDSVIPESLTVSHPSSFSSLCIWKRGQISSHSTRFHFSTAQCSCWNARSNLLAVMKIERRGFLTQIAPFKPANWSLKRILESDKRTPYVSSRSFCTSRGTLVLQASTIS